MNKNTSNDMTPLEELLGAKLLSCKGDEICTSTLARKKQIILYFSAHWCPPCRRFTPVLSKAYEEYIKNIGDAESEIEVLFISRDSDEKACDEYHAEMTFPRTMFDTDLSAKLCKKYGVRGIPSLVIINPEGKRINNDDSIDMRSLIAEHGAAAFPLTPSRIRELKSEAASRSAASLKALYDDTVPFVVTSKQGEKISFKDVLEQNDHVGILLGDGDYFSDGCYTMTREVVDKVNIDRPNTLKTIYVGWSLYNDDCDHAKISSFFDFSIQEITDDLRDALKNITKGPVAAPTMITVRRGTGVCNINGECEPEGVPVIVSMDRGMRILGNFGSEAFPWDEIAVTKYQEREKSRIENLKAKLAGLEFLTAARSEDKQVLVQNKDLKDEDINSLLDIGEDGIVGLYFSAHWCPPCQRFTPMLVEYYEQQKAAGKKFQVVFISSDRDRDEFESYFNSMVTKQGDQFLAIDFEQRRLKTDLSDIFGINSIPSLVLLKQDGTIITKDGVKMVANQAAEKANIDSLKQEKENEEKQKNSGLPVVKRLIGEPADVQHDVSDRTLTLEKFSTMGVPELLTNNGVLYYEIEILKGDYYGCPQFGFSLKNGMKESESHYEEGVGDNEKSWALDGGRGLKWHNDNEEPWSCEWGPGSVIGLAANIDKGMIAISIDGDWTGRGLGVVFQNDAIKDGVYPCMSARNYEVRYSFTKKEVKYGLPPSLVWDSPPSQN